MIKFIGKRVLQHYGTFLKYVNIFILTPILLKHGARFGFHRPLPLNSPAHLTLTITKLYN